ncbi:hypothetical protein SAMN05661008_01077 [Alkalithermobacter thermoalcaliphilus JW-YL-7 = DSM 7308]|uniref:Uncharacterized protein n=1 Tax=Alkalithermobacter thermoalcaliphilus JW-YL-7 = DSM 7308 TaxID=1121328 RepID=A0A150FN83_CLOPD|nr:protein of unknown function DUF322 [[Clostridium] paradoxum JW-YL-7 = DSM 7308]SHK89593.1 hypothetical protein SAMN05661008_01077 [[Clostridium] paradoxum JW-YL-7 = DSM 7308]
MKVYSLVGPSGTGKSYRALKVAYENDIDYIIDDGILIYKNKIVVGISAKNAPTKMEAVKRAIFEDLSHRNKVKLAIKSENIKKILVIGTSRKMIDKICKRLELGKVYKEISIYDIATEEEINIARKMRIEQGIHIVPVPTFEVKRHFSGLFRNPIKLLFKNRDSQEKEFEKTLVRPTFSYLGKYFISQKAISQIIDYEITKFTEYLKNYTLNITHFNNGIKVSLKIGINYTKIYPLCRQMQQDIFTALEKMTLINVISIDITVVRIYFDK